MLGRGDVEKKDGVEAEDAVVYRREPARLEAKSIPSRGIDRSSSSLLSDCTRGLVGGLYMKLDDKDDDNGEVPDLNPSVLPEKGTLRSNWKGVKCLGGEVAIHGPSGWMG